jgi:hypothetical protein
MMVAVLAAVLVAGCTKAPTAADVPRRDAPGAAFDEVPPPPPPSSSGGINGLGSGN